MRKITCLVLLGIALVTQAQTNVYLKEDFSKGIPAGYVLKDYNENPVAVTDFKAGRVNDTWTTYNVDSDEINAAICTSRGEKEIAADKWMITPSVKIESDKAWLSWDAKSIHYDIRDGYKVMISTTDQSPASFKEVFSIDEEDYFWAHHFVSLKEYQNKNIYVAFVNNSDNKYILAVTNLFIGVPVPGEFEIIDETPRFVGNIPAATVTGKIRNIGGTVKLSELACLAGAGEPLKQQFENVTLEPGEAADFEFSLPVTVGKAAYYTLKVTTDAHTEKEILADSIICSNFPMTLVAEERTATWCNTCPRGTLYMNLLKKRYKDEMITIVGHGDKDPMFVDFYGGITGLGKWVIDMPGFIYNRVGPSLYYPDANSRFSDEKIHKALVKPVLAKVELTAKYDDKLHSAVSVEAKAYFADNIDNSKDRYRISYAIIEKTVTGYIQQNTLSLPATKEFDFLPVAIPKHLTVFHNVARGTENAFTGIEKSLPEAIEADTEYKNEFKIQIPENVIDHNNISIVVFIVDTSNKSIVNACEVRTPTFHPGYSSIDETANSVLKINVYQTPDKQSVQIVLPEGAGETASVRMTGLDGRTIFAGEEKTSNVLSIPSAGVKGCYIISVVVNNQTISKKIMLN